MAIKKIKMKSLLHFFSKLFNITHYEWPRVLFAFVLKVSVYVVYVTGSTLLTASFLEQYHIENLPLLYIFVSSATILGSFLF